MKALLSCLLVLTLFGCNTPATKPLEEPVKHVDFTQHVNPLIGTSRMGHCFPGATAPFGMVQVTPQTRWEPFFEEGGNYNSNTYSYCSGFQYSDSTILGFAHTAFSGTGHSDLGDILLMPTTTDWDTEAPYTPGAVSRFDPGAQVAEPGYYSAHLLDPDIQVEVTATERVGLHKYTFAEHDSAKVVLDLIYNIYHHPDKNVWTFLRVENDTLITGYRQSTGWARTRTVYFALAFSEPIVDYTQDKQSPIAYDGFYRRFNQDEQFPEMAGKDIRVLLDFGHLSQNEVQVKCALSSVSTNGALHNLATEMPGWDFAQVRKQTKADWNTELSKIAIEPLAPEDMRTFYTALYHTCLSPIVYEDCDGRYRGLDQNIHSSEGFVNHSVFSLWDTYRALHPLYNLIQPERNNNMVHSMLAHQEQSVHGMLPIWSHYANENWCMIGYHATSVIADATVKKVGDFDRKRALDACIESAYVPYFDGLDGYLQNGYFPDDQTHSSVSKTLEIAYDDWCIAQVAEQVGDSEAGQVFATRSRSFENTFDPASGWMRPRLADGTFRKAFDPLDTHGQGFIEGNAWNYGLYVPQDIPRMIALMGGNERFCAHLDSLFTMELEDHHIAQHEDITRDGILGLYIHGNEPGHHIPYLYSWAGQPEKTAQWVRRICGDMYGHTVDGLCGNDDAGQMSAWYVFSSLGFYPVTPGSTDYTIGSPSVLSARVQLDHDTKSGAPKYLVIRTENQSEVNTRVSKVTWNGSDLTGHTLSHLELIEGGELVYHMAPQN